MLSLGSLKTGRSLRPRGSFPDHPLGLDLVIRTAQYYPINLEGRCAWESTHWLKILYTDSDPSLVGKTCCGGGQATYTARWQQDNRKTRKKKHEEDNSAAKLDTSRRRTRGQQEDKKRTTRGQMTIGGRGLETGWQPPSRCQQEDSKWRGSRGRQEEFNSPLAHFPGADSG